MPYVWSDPEVLLTHRGVTLYVIYQDDCFTNPPREFWYGFTSTCSDGDPEGAVDIRDIVTLLPESRHVQIHDHRAIFKALIEAGFLTESGFMIDGYLCDNADTIRVAVEEFVTKLTHEQNAYHEEESS